MSKKRLEEEYQRGRIVIRKDGEMERRRHPQDHPGIIAGTLWGDIPPVFGKESEGYFAQKPLKLLDRIQASSDEGGIALDPFYGCGTSIHSAINNKRKYIGMNISAFSINSITKDRIAEKCNINNPIHGILSSNKIKRGDGGIDGKDCFTAKTNTAKTK